jgi:hypothetical protein
MEKSFCGKPVEVSVTSLDCEGVLVFGEFRRVEARYAFKIGDEIELEQVSRDFFVSRFSHFIPSMKRMIFKFFPSRKWCCSEKIKRSAWMTFVVYFAVNGKIQDILVSPSFEILESKKGREPRKTKSNFIANLVAEKNQADHAQKSSLNSTIQRLPMQTPQVDHGMYYGQKATDFLMYGRIPNFFPSGSFMTNTSEVTPMISAERGMLPFKQF